jgi:RNA polymerase sigma-70 factor, ECF subfamily
VKGSDEERMQAVARGDLDAFRDLVLAHQRPAWSVAVRFLRDPAEAEDVVQEAFLRILRAAPRYRPTASFRTYLFQVVTRLCIDAAEKRHTVYTDELPDVADPSPGPPEGLAAREEVAEVQRALQALPPSQRMAVILQHYEGLRYAEIAQAMGTTVKGVEGLLARARSALQARLASLQGG